MRDCLDNSNLDDDLDVFLLGCQNISNDGKGFYDNEIKTNGPLNKYEEVTFNPGCREKCIDSEFRKLYRWFFGTKKGVEEVDDYCYWLLPALREYCDIDAYEQR